MKSLLAAAVLFIAVTGCGSSSSADDMQAQPPMSEADIAGPSQAADPTRASIDPATVKVSKCRFREDDYGGGTVTYGVESTSVATNTTQLTGTLSLTIQYQAADGTAITEGSPGANHIKPGQRAKINDSALVEPDDFPGEKVTCVVTDAKVYVPIE